MSEESTSASTFDTEPVTVDEEVTLIPDLRGDLLRGLPEELLDEELKAQAQRLRSNIGLIHRSIDRAGAASRQMAFRVLLAVSFLAGCIVLAVIPQIQSQVSWPSFADDVGVLLAVPAVVLTAFALQQRTASRRNMHRYYAVLDQLEIAARQAEELIMAPRKREDQTEVRP